MRRIEMNRLILTLALLLFCSSAWAQLKISELTAASAVSDSDTGVIVQSGTTKKAAISLFRAITASQVSDSTGVGRALLTVTNPSAIRFIKINADNTVTLRTAAEMLSDIGAQASGSYLTSSNISDTAYASSWNAVTDTAPSKNTVYDWGVTFDTDDDGKVNVLDAISSAGFPYTNSSGAVQGTRSITGTSNEITVTNGDGASGAPTLSLPSTIDISGKTSFNLVSGTAPTVDAAGELAFDTNQWASGRGAAVIYDGTAATAVVAALTSDTPTNGQVPKWNTGGTITWEDDNNSGGGGAPTDATYITQTANGTLSAEQALSSLSTGIMRVATTTGVITSLTDSSGIAANLSDETGSGALVFASAPAMVGPVVGNGATSAGYVDFNEDTDNGSNRVRLIGPSSTADVTLTLPASTDTVVGRDTTDTLTNKTLTSPTLTTPVLGTPSSGTLTNCTGLPVSGITSSTSTALGVGSLELGNASDTTLARVSAGVVSIEGTNIIKASDTVNALSSSTSANLRTLLSDETGAGNAMFTRTGVRRTVYVSAGAMIGRTTNGAATGTTELATNDIMQDSFDFDSATEEGVGFWWTPPSTWDASTITFKAHWTAASGSGTVKWDFAARGYADDDAMDQALGTEQGSTDTLLATGDMHISPTTSALTVGGTPAANRPVYVQVARDVATDTLNADAKLLGVTIEFTESTTEPSAQ